YQQSCCSNSRTHLFCAPATSSELESNGYDHVHLHPRFFAPGPESGPELETNTHVTRRPAAGTV
ncbi:unnamed protein product, partial [Ectocarpus sp. 4 AP-2014]